MDIQLSNAFNEYLQFLESMDGAGEELNHVKKYSSPIMPSNYNVSIVPVGILHKDNSDNVNQIISTYGRYCIGSKKHTPNDLLLEMQREVFDEELVSQYNGGVIIPLHLPYKDRLELNELVRGYGRSRFDLLHMRPTGFSREDIENIVESSTPEESLFRTMELLDEGTIEIIEKFRKN